MNNINKMYSNIFLLSYLLVVITLTAEAQNQTFLHDKGTDLYINPIFAGNYPDPNILRDGDDYYIVHSSFEYYPGLLIWHSKDMINWNPVANALYKYVGSVWAPDIVKYNNKYYIYFPANNINYLVTSDIISSHWSDPIELKIGNIDHGHVTDENGKEYLFFVYSGVVPLSDYGLI